MLFQSGSLGRGRGGATGSGSDSYWGSRDQGLRGFQNSDRARGGHRGDRGGHGGRGGRGGRGELSTEDRNQIMIARREETLQVAMTEGTDDIICAASAPDETFQNFAIHVLDQWVVEAYDCWAVRRFINSCLVNLSNHHSVDVSRLIPALATSNGLGRLNKLMSMTMIIDGGDGDYMCQGQLSFQYDVLPLVGVLTREKVCLATLTTESNAIYNTVYSHRKKFLEDGILPCMARLITRGSIEDGIVSSDKMNRIKSYACSVKSLQRALLAVVRLVFQLIKRIREARLELAPIVVALYEQAKGSRSLTGTSSNERYLNDIVVKELERLKRMTSDIEERNVATLQTREKVRPTQLRAHYYAYDPPGNLSIYGARHGNDEVNIKEISILPALDEIVCQRSPFLPANGFSEAVHFHDPGWRRQLDIHFRLYREDLVNPLRKGVIGFMEILDMIPRSQERDVLNPKELRKFLPRGLLRVYKIVQILKVDIDWNEGPGLLISIEQPAQLRGMDAEARKMFWERAKNRLMSGGLVSLVRRATLPIDQKSSDLTIEDKFEMHLAVVMGKNIKSLSKDENLAYISITSSDPELYSLLFASDTNKNQWYLIETAGGYLEASRPILKALQNADPAMLPFGRYLAPTIQEMEMNAKEPGHISPPIYATAPEFQFDLSVLLNGRNVNLDVRSPSSARSAVRALQDYSNLDHTQAEALVESLCREVALISGPPGTGKTKIGVDIMRVLLRNREEMNCGPILCICYTNYALDQFLEHLLAIGETNIVRIGSRSKSEKLESYSLHNRKQSTQSYFARRAVAIASQRINEYQEKIKHVEEEIKAPRLPWIAVEEFLSNSYPEIYRRLLNGPPLSQDHPSLYRDSAIFNHWINGVDIGDRIKANNDNRERLRKLRFRVLDMDELESRYRIPMTNRPLEELDNDVWEMSRLERKRLFESWRGPIHELLKSTLNDYIQEVNEAVAERQAAHDDSNRQVLQSCSVIGMTTNGAAKMNELISSISPKIILCEEAGEVLESHILSALSPSTQHLILIGDYLQLRPQIETYELSMDSASGKLYKLDQSLFERLVTAQENPLPMSKLTIQRRMRPEISSLIRTTLYPHLQDGPNVHEYPSVTGMCDNIYFMDHDHPENGKDQDGVSFSNAFEVEMIEALALYLIKNGYDKEGDISILTPYLGQLSRLRDELSKSFTLKLDERDQELLDQMDESATRPVQADVSASESAKAIASGKEVSLKNQLTLRTIDNYQGEEAKIIIVSLVRNQSDSISGGIGFLKSPNRTNVLLSRAQHGMFILGNAKLMESKIEFGIWPQIISELREKDRIGKGFRLRCKKHPTTQNIVDKPSALKMCAPKGGCTQPCGYNLVCGHVCPLQCHPDDPTHSYVKCTQPCMRLQSGCLHPCEKKCSHPCGRCMHIVEPILLPCMHLLTRPFCFQKMNLSQVVCKSMVSKQLPTCGHIQHTLCSQDTKDLKCDALFCDVTLEAHRHLFTVACKSCATSAKNAVSGFLPEVKNPRAPSLDECDKVLLCGHPCQSSYHRGSTCPPCPHTLCKATCNAACSPYHDKYNIPGGAPCHRLPYNRRCEKLLLCGHQCPSVCDESFPVTSFCQECKDPEKIKLVKELLTQDTLAHVNLTENTILILPCGHAMTMTTLEEMTQIQRFNKVRVDKKAGSSSFVSKLQLPGSKLESIKCPHCREPILGSLRYGRQTKYAQLATGLKRHTGDWSAAVFNAQLNLKVALKKLAFEQATSLASLLSSRAEESWTPPLEADRSIAKLVRAKDRLPELSLRLVMHNYNIPPQQVILWRKMTAKLEEAGSYFRNIYENAMKAPTRNVFETVASRLHFSDGLEDDIQERGSEGENWPSDLEDDTENEGESWPSDLEDDAESEGENCNWLVDSDDERSEWMHDESPGHILPSSFSQTSNMAPTKSRPSQLIESESMERAAVPHILRDYIRKCGVPVIGYGGTSHLDALQGLLDVFMTATKLVFMVLDEGYEMTGWYWFQEDLIHGAVKIASKYVEAAREGKFYLRELAGQVHILELIVRQARWRSMQSEAFEFQNPMIEDILGLEQVFKKVYHKVMELYRGLDFDTDEPKHIKKRCGARARALEVYIQV